MKTAMEELAPTEVELHVSPCALERKHLRKIKQAGGRYSHVRGYPTKRFVHLPIDKIDVIDEIIRVNREWYSNIRQPNGDKTVIFRGGKTHPLPAWVTVHYTNVNFEVAVRKFEAAYERHLAFRAANPNVWGM